jgi:ABC-2 type transport system ATP-binding protein
VTGLSAANIGEIAADAGIALHGLSPQAASLEEAFMETTHDSIDYEGLRLAAPIGSNPQLAPIGG